MQDRIVEHPNRYLIVPVDGDRADLIPSPGEVLQEGTPLNKASLLSDQTAAEIGVVGQDPTVDQALQTLNYKLLDKAEIASGTYTGTGTCGANNPCHLTFPFEPKLVLVSDEDHLLILHAGTDYAPNFGIQSQTISGTYTNDGYFGMRVFWSDTGVSWYHSNTEGQQMNAQGTTYLYTALGVME